MTTTLSHSDRSADFAHAMLDIETMSTHPNNALILSIGLVQFDLRPEGVVIGDRRLWLPNLATQLLKGREVDRSTQVDFWAKQPLAASLDWASEAATNSVGWIHEDMGQMLKGVGRVWARGTVFDIGNVASFFRSFNLIEPWKYTAPHCVRNLCTDARQLRDGTIEQNVRYVGSQGQPLPPPTTLLSHAAVSDCIWQALDVWRHWDFNLT